MRLQAQVWQGKVKLGKGFFPQSTGDWGDAVPGLTGCFEVILVESGKVLHSKTNGHCYVDTDAKLDPIINGRCKSILPSKRHILLSSTVT